MSALKKKKITSTFYIYYQFYLFFIIIIFFLCLSFFFFMLTKQIFIFISQFSYLLSCIFLVTKRYTLQFYVIHWNPPVKDSQSQVSQGLIDILHMATRQSGVNTNAAPTLHALTRKGLPLPLARKLKRKLVTTEIQFFWKKSRSKFKVNWAVICCASPLEIPKQREREKKIWKRNEKTGDKAKK